MPESRPVSPRAAAVVLPCADLDAMLAFLRERLGFQLDEIGPADAPKYAELSGHGLRIRLERGADVHPGIVRVRCDGLRESATLSAPNGTRIELVGTDLPPLPPPPLDTPVATRSRDTEWHQGRAGMQYRDLIPRRWNGRIVASHIRIPRGGPVADYVHYHEVRFQLIYCHRGTVQVVYEDQGPPFTLAAGDVVLQPPEIRHRVLACSDGLEVIELACPAAHATRVDHELELPTAGMRAERAFAGQRFVHHVGAAARWSSSPGPGIEVCGTTLHDASGGGVGVRVVRSTGAPQVTFDATAAEMRFVYLLRGHARSRGIGEDDDPLLAGDCLAVPGARRWSLDSCSADLELLEVSCDPCAGKPR
ncbi:MAG: cupin domain-containing protein [Planctomycetes bacterium]|nr:cupin domain-containing protein [Planctomycetota bacterium]MCB9888700.1 cupin domain-containing protein [Planctomycetota bacterium]